MIISFDEQFVDKILDGSKRHTILEDKHRLLQADDTIRFATGTSATNYNQFKEGVCEWVEGIELYPKTRDIYLERNGEMKLLSGWLTEDFIKNEGFDSEDEFWEWYCKPFKGVLVYWAEIIYIIPLGYVMTYRRISED